METSSKHANLQKIKIAVSSIYDIRRLIISNKVKVISNNDFMRTVYLRKLYVILSPYQTETKKEEDGNISGNSYSHFINKVNFVKQLHAVFLPTASF